MARLHDWRVRLSDEIERQRRVPFAWGQADCALFVADCLRAMTGEDVAAAWRGTYQTALGAQRALRDAGHDGLAALAAALFEPVAPAFAGIGDIAVWTDDGHPVVGIVIGERVMGRMIHGLGTVDRMIVEQAFRVP